MERVFGPIELMDEVVIAAGPPARHRGLNAAEIAANGDLLVLYKEGTLHHRIDDEAVVLARSTDGGHTWTDRRTIAAVPGSSFWTHHGLTRLSDGTLLLRLMHGRHVPESRNPEGVYRQRRPVTTWSTDNGQTWAYPTPEVDLPPLDPMFCVSYGRIHELSDGRLMAPFFGIPRGSPTLKGRTLVMAFSRDRGKSWTEHTVVHHDHEHPEWAVSETDVIRLPNGRLMAMCRTNILRVLHRSFSGDEGRTWSPLEPTGLPGHCPGLIELRSGALLCLYRDVSSPRDVETGVFGVGVGVSRDAGLTWEHLGRLYEATNQDCGYPSPVRLTNGLIFSPFYTNTFPVGAAQVNCEVHGLFLRERDV